MNFTLYSDVILLRDLPEENVYAGDIGTVVEQHNVPGLETGYSVEFFDMLGNTVAIVTLPMSYFRLPNSTDRPAVRLMTHAA
ncbi:DUF4926 domain-containing protein [Dolichospermum flos-aquae]|jgi:hypothetical protein|uniref:DUF4926 domain-containing protein n=1 Tax=Dolichospermum flos-aquae CCAP 1403/13F TaxID=315271 RepID=A0A6H2BWN5_DOLFA|nr:DUF4926 domain-containing protein [Dolichospermum flos-aquae]QJB43194.1 DUF4926 domain-containing protein [Dolichospermum flos-aquae CCAP 1403/13F]